MKVKVKEVEKLNDYLYLARELKKLWNINVTVILIIVGALGMVPKNLAWKIEELNICERIETVQTPALLKSAKILRKVLET